MRYPAFVEARVCQGIVDDAAAICGALLAELRLREDLLGPGPTAPDAGSTMVTAALGGTLASSKTKKEDTARKIAELVEAGHLPDGPPIDPPAPPPPFGPAASPSPSAAT